MNIQRKLTSITTAAALAASALVPLSTAASAEGWRDGNRSGGQSYNAYNHAQSRDYDRGDRGHDYQGYDRGRYDRYAYGRHRHHDNGKYIALGIGALMLGIIASEASHR